MDCDGLNLPDDQSGGARLGPTVRCDAPHEVPPPPMFMRLDPHESDGDGE